MSIFSFNIYCELSIDQAFVKAITCLTSDRHFSCAESVAVESATLSTQVKSITNETIENFPMV